MNVSVWLFCRENIRYYKELPLHELFYYDDVKSLRAAVNAAPRVAVYTALTKPHVYLQVPLVTISIHVVCSVFLLELNCISMYGQLRTKPSDDGSACPKTFVP